MGHGIEMGKTVRADGEMGEEWKACGEPVCSLASHGPHSEVPLYITSYQRSPSRKESSTLNRCHL